MVILKRLQSLKQHLVQRSKMPFKLTTAPEVILMAKTASKSKESNAESRRKSSQTTKKKALSEQTLSQSMKVSISL